MQRLKVSGAVRPIYGSLGVKRLITLYIPATTERNKLLQEKRHSNHQRSIVENKRQRIDSRQGEDILLFLERPDRRRTDKSAGAGS